MEFEMGTSLVGVYTMPDTSLLGNLMSSIDEKHGIVFNMTTFLVREFFGGQVSWATSNPWTRDLAFIKTPTRGIYFQHFFHLV
jgi:hypothetical protein